MNVTVPFGDDARQRLQRAVQGDRDLDWLAGIIACAGAREALDQATGEFAPTSMTDQRSYRIYCLIQEGLPVADAYALIAGIFQVSDATAKRYVDTALARYRVELEPKVDAAIAVAFADKAPGQQYDSETWWIPVPDALMPRVRQLIHEAGQPEATSARKGTIWKFPDESYQAVRVAVRLPRRSPPKQNR